METVKKIKSLVPNQGYTTTGKLSVMFDWMFVIAEPNIAKRMWRMKRIFTLHPRVEDLEWVVAMYKEAKEFNVKARKIAIKNKIIKFKV